MSWIPCLDKINRVVCIGSVTQDIFVKSDVPISCNPGECNHYQASEFVRSYGGCSANISLTLSKLGVQSDIFVPSTSVEYADHFSKSGIKIFYGSAIPDTSLPRYVVIMDPSGHRLTFFNQEIDSGGPDYLRLLASSELGGGVLAILSADSFENMWGAYLILRDNMTNIVFDPGPSSYYFPVDKYFEIMKNSTITLMNNREASAICARSGKSLDELTSISPVTIITRGVDGVSLYIADGGRIYTEPSIPAPKTDESGCGDAFRAGLLYSILAGCNSPSESIRSGLYCSTLVLQEIGAQSFNVSEKDLRDYINTAEFN